MKPVSRWFALCIAVGRFVTGLSQSATEQIVKQPEQPPGCVPTVPGAGASWRADNDAIDALGANHGALQGGAVFGPGLVGSAFSFNGSTSYVAAPDHDSWAFGANDFTIEFWVNFRAVNPSSDIGRPSVIFVANDEGPGTFNKWFFSLGAGRLYFHLYSATAGAKFLGQAPFSPELNRWYHLALARAGNVFGIYQDGALIGSETAAVTVPNANAPLTIGQGEGMSFLNGSMDEVAIYRRALSELEIKSIYQAGAAGKCGSNQSGSVILARWKFDEANGTRAEDSAGPFDGVLSPQGATFVSGGVAGNALSLSKASNGFVNMGDVLNLTSGSFSVVAWSKMNNGDATPNSLVLGKHGSGNNDGYFLNVNKWNASLGRDNQAMFFAGDTRTSLHSTARVNDGNWHQLAGVYQAGGNTVIYVDGAPAEAGIPSLPIMASPAPFLIGGASLDGNPTGLFSGLIDEVQVYQGALSGSEVEFLFRNPGQMVPQISGPTVGNDGIPDAWRQQFFGPDFARDSRALAIADPDGDGASNYQEFLAGTNPVDATSAHRIPLSIRTYAGSTQGRQDGPLASATFTYPVGFARDAQGRLYVTEAYAPSLNVAGFGGQSIRQIDTSGTVSTWTGGAEPGLVEGPRQQARYRVPNYLVFDSFGNAFITDRYNHRIRKVDTNGVVSTFAGSTAGFRDGTGTNAQFRAPIGITIDPQNNLYVADWENFRVRKITPDGTVSTFAGSVRGNQNGPRTSATFDGPVYVALGQDGNLYVADWGNGQIRRIAPDGIVSTFASGLPFVEAVEVDSQGNVYAVASSLNALVKFNSNGREIWRLAPPRGTQDGPISVAKITHFNAPFLFPNGDILLAEDGAHRLRLVKVGPPPLLLASPVPGPFTNSVTVALTTPVPNGMIRYTLDRTDPVTNSTRYTNAFRLSVSSTARARVFVNDIPVSEIWTGDFIDARVNDGIPLAWRERYFGPDYATNTAAAAVEDPDDDGANNYQEFLAGTNPRDRNSVFKLPDSVSTYAGSTEGTNDGFRTAAKFNGIPDLAFDAQGQLWVPEANVIGYDVPGPGLHRLRLMGTNEVVGTFAGAEAGFADGPASLARFSIPQAFVFDSHGGAFLLERGNYRIRKIDPRGSVSTFAGSTRGYRDGPATQAQFDVPLGLCVDAADNLYVADFFNLRIRKVTPQGEVSTFAGGSRGRQNGPRATATFDSPADVACAKDGTLYVADWSNGMVRKIDTNGVVSTFASGMTYIDRVSLDSAGNIYASGGFGGISKFSPDGKLLWSIKNPPGWQDGPAAQARFTYPTRVLERPDGNLLVGDIPRIRLITLRAPPLLEIQIPAAGTNTQVKVFFRSVVTNATVRYTLDQSSPNLNSPLYTGDLTVNRPATIRARAFVNDLPISEIVTENLLAAPPPDNASILVTTLAGSGSIGAQDGRGSGARFSFPNAGFVSPRRLSFIADAFNHRIRQVDLVTGDVATIAGAGLAGFQDGPSATALFNVPQGVAANAAGEIFVADAQNHRIRKISSNNPRSVTTVAGDGTAGYRDGPALTAQFNFPNDLVLDSEGNLYVSEFNNHTIRKITPAGAVSTFVGNGRIGSADGVGQNAGLNGPGGLAIDRAGNLYVTEWQGHRVRKITREGTVTVLAGNTISGFADGFGTAARFKEPDGIVVDPLGDLFVTEHGNHTIRKITAQGNVTTVAGTGVAGFADGGGSVAQFIGPGGIGWDRNGSLVVADTGNHRVRLVRFLLLPEVTSAPQDQSLSAGATAVFQVKATGPEPLVYQWYFKDAPTPGATNATLTLTNVQPANAGKYSVVIGNGRGVVESAQATLTVLRRSDFVQRDLPSSYTGGSKLTVQLRATPPADASAYAVEETPPTGWVVSDISDGGVFDAVRRKVKFGPFFDRQTRTLTYQITPPPNESGRREFSGTASVDGENGLIGGDAAIDSAPLHPADRNPADFRLAIDEVTAYGTAWRKGTRWPVEPNPIPIDFVTRAGTLWKNGESYFYNSSVTTAPAWWEPLAAGGSTRLQARPRALALRSVTPAERRMPERFVPTETFAVEIAVAPPAGVSVYAAQDEIPAGWTAVQISHAGEFDAAARLVKWGPYFDNAARTLRYEIRLSPQRIDLAEFKGFVSFDGESVSVSGPRQSRAGIRLSALTRMTEGRLQLHVAGWPEAAFSIETSTDLKNWKPLQSFVNRDASITIDDPAASSQPQRFYRATER